MIVGFSKLFSDIIHSTVWREEMHVKIVWVTMLAMADKHGQVMASIPGLADAAKVTLEQCLDALEKFSSPDEYSRTKDYDGRRIVEIDGGWLLLNYEKFRERRDDEEQRIQTRDRVRRYRERASAISNIVTENVTVTPSNDNTEADTDTKTEAEEKKREPLKKASRIPVDFSLTQTMRAWAQDRRPTLDADIETEKFVNYWTAKAGRSATKLDWQKTWQNWILNARESVNGNYRQQREQDTVRDRNIIESIRHRVTEPLLGHDVADSPRQLSSGGAEPDPA